MVLDSKHEVNRDEQPLAPLVQDKRSGLAAHEPAPSEIDEVVESLILWAQRTYGNEEIMRARAEFLTAAGTVFPEDTFFNDRMTYFLDYFTLQRPLSEHGGMTPLESCQSRLAEGLESGVPGLQLIDDFRHSIFAVKSRSKDRLELVDLLTESKFRISPRYGESFQWLEKAKLVQGFLIRFAGKWHLSRGLVFHPASGFQSVKKFAKALRKSGRIDELPVLWRLAYTQLRSVRLNHADPIHIYGPLNKS